MKIEKVSSHAGKNPSFMDVRSQRQKTTILPKFSHLRDVRGESSNVNRTSNEFGESGHASKFHLLQDVSAEIIVLTFQHRLVFFD